MPSSDDRDKKRQAKFRAAVAEYRRAKPRPDAAIPIEEALRKMADAGCTCAQAAAFVLRAISGVAFADEEAAFVAARIGAIFSAHERQESADRERYARRERLVRQGHVPANVANVGKVGSYVGDIRDLLQRRSVADRQSQDG